MIQPDGRMIREFTWKAGPQNHYSGKVQLPANALTGKWRVEFRHGTGELEPYPFVVAEFLPEQMKLVIDEDEKIQDKKQDLEIRLQGDFLYGAPASGLRANALVHVKPARELFKDQWPGFEFGGIKGLINTSFTSDDIRLDDDGKGVIPVERQWEKVISPHWVTANVSLYGSGGRPVVRNTSWQVWPANTLVGIRNISSAEEDPHQVANDSVAAFEVILADRRGTLLGAKGLKATIIREHREYYWEFKNGEWHWGSTSQFYPMDRFSLDISKAGKARVNVPVKWRGYRLEIENPETGLTSAFTFWAGWRPDSGREMNRPDRVDLFLDRPAYLAGEKAMVTVKAPKGGKGFLFVEADKNLLTLAAVDVGILNLTKFKTPSPFDYFFQTRQYGAQLHDVYQKLIEAGKEGDASQRFGGDAPSLTRGGDRPATDVQIVAMRKLALNTDDQGRAVFNLDLPDFDGSLRLMAVAHTVHEFGAADREMVLASPLVVQATMPRFLACRDRGEPFLLLTARAPLYFTPTNTLKTLMSARNPGSAK
ncbi:MAG: hypothetical protein HUK40_12450 [Desulfobacter sp.]|nr:hypothetical protein [Desulfobacter sp.]